MGKLALAAIVSLWIVPISIMVNHIVPEPYMDEIFHIPQAQQYCKGNFGSWDPMITTPPGLYYLSLAHVASLFPGLYCVKAASSIFDMCSAAILRSINGILAVICSIILFDIIVHLKPTLGDRKVLLRAVVLSLYPLHWFFTFLYYTDVASVTAVLAMYLASLKNKYWFSALIGAFAVVIRQTNIIWVLFVACTAIINISLIYRKDDARTAESDGSINPGLPHATGMNTVGSNLRKRKFVKSVDTVNKPSFPSIPASSTSFSPGLVDEIQTILLTLWHMKLELFISFSPFVMVLVAFLLFVRWNGSVVLGAKEAHMVTPHVAQILYFSLVSVLALAPFTVNQAVDLFQLFTMRRPIRFFQMFLALLVGILSVHFFSVAHPYLLADNRHYPFYLWRKVIMAHWSIKYVLVPFFVFSWLSIINMLGKSRNKIWILAYFLATAAVLVPAPLIEFRYYTIPFYFLVLHCDIRGDLSWVLTGILFIGMNIFTMMMFLFRPFHWDHEPGIQRFIW